MIETYKILKQHLIIDSTTLFTLPPINFTRGHNFKLCNPRSRLLVRSKFFTDRIINQWNSLPYNVINAQSIDFKNKLDTFWTETGYGHITRNQWPTNWLINVIFMSINNNNNNNNTNCDVVKKSTVISTHIEQWKNEGLSLHEQWPKLMDELNADSYCWLHNAYLNPVTESLLIAAQDQELNTNWLNCHIHHTVSSDLCRQCKMYPETIEHTIAGCPTIVILMIAQTIYLDRHNAVTSAIHWCLCGLCGFSCSTQWWQHQPQAASDNDNFKLLYDFNTYTDRRISARRPDIVYMDKGSGCTKLLDVASLCHGQACC